MEIKILGTGCPNCKRLEKNTRAALALMDSEAVVTKVTEMDDITAYDILATPGLVINGKVVCSGRVPTVSEITSMIGAAMIARSL
jgi:small redox-active disulfide protein 2